MVEMLHFADKNTFFCKFQAASPFWCPTELTFPDGKTKEFPLAQTGQQFVYDNSGGLFFEAEEVRRCILQGLTESPSLSLDESLAIAKVLEDIRLQIGALYTLDNNAKWN